MDRTRVMLLSVSTAVVLSIVGGGLALKVGAADRSYGPVILFSEVLSLVMDNYVEHVEEADLLTGACEGMLDGLDVNGAYLTPEEVVAWKKETGPGLVGPGLSVLKGYGALQVVAISENSPAEAAGIERGDQIREVDGQEVRDLSLEQALRLLHGEPGSKVRLTVLRPRDAFAKRELEVTRAARKDAPYVVEVVDGIAVLTLRDLERVDAAALEEELDLVRSRGLAKLMIDLRNLVDGTPRDAKTIAALFATGPLLKLTDPSGKTLEELASDGPGEAWQGSIGLLVNAATAGGAEALVRVLQSKRGATVYGEATYGLGSEAELFELPDRSALLLSAHLWETTTGETWNGEGIEPDHEVAPRGEDAADDQRREAIEAFARQPEEALASEAA